MPFSLIDFAERGQVPDWLIRMGIRRLLRRRLEEVTSRFVDHSLAGRGELLTSQFAEEMRNSPMVVAADSANDQHYEVPPEFFETVLGRHLKYSCGLWATDDVSLDNSEAAMLQLTCQRAEIEDGMRILELGCGWGSLTLWMAEHYPACRITAVSNSAPQRRYIERQCAERGIGNVEVLTNNIADFRPDRQFDRVVSVEMFEHVRNYELLLNRIADWLHPDGKLFVHIFCHRQFAYPFETNGASDWMARHFFTGGIMPSEDLLREFPDDLGVSGQWHVSGLHYSRTCEAWLEKLDANADSLRELFGRELGAREASVQLQRWRMFFMACSELFRFRGGEEWGVGHYLLTRQKVTGGRDEQAHLPLMRS